MTPDEIAELRRLWNEYWEAKSSGYDILASDSAESICETNLILKLLNECEELRSYADCFADKIEKAETFRAIKKLCE